MYQLLHGNVNGYVDDAYIFYGGLQVEITQKVNTDIKQISIQCESKKNFPRNVEKQNYIILSSKTKEQIWIISSGYKLYHSQEQ